MLRNVGDHAIYGVVPRVEPGGGLLTAVCVFGRVHEGVRKSGIRGAGLGPVDLPVAVLVHIKPKPVGDVAAIYESAVRLCRVLEHGTDLGVQRLHLRCVVRRRRRDEHVVPGRSPCAALRCTDGVRIVREDLRELFIRSRELLRSDKVDKDSIHHP